eukprot:2616847-Prymnesium_polylepis.1
MRGRMCCVRHPLRPGRLRGAKPVSLGGFRPSRHAMCCPRSPTSCCRVASTPVVSSRTPPHAAQQPPRRAFHRRGLPATPYARHAPRRMRHVLLCAPPLEVRREHAERLIHLPDGRRSERTGGRVARKDSDVARPLGVGGDAVWVGALAAAGARFGVVRVLVDDDKQRVGRHRRIPRNPAARRHIRLRGRRERAVVADDEPGNRVVASGPGEGEVCDSGVGRMRRSDSGEGRRACRRERELGFGIQGEGEGRGAGREVSGC